MLWLKKKYILKLSGGKQSVETDSMFGLIQHLIVEPESKDLVWSMQIKDSVNDVIFEVLDQSGRLDRKDNIPIGADKQERLTISIFDTTANENVKVIFKVRETI